MLTPDYLYNIADRAIERYEELNTWAVNDICRRLVNADWQFTGSVDWQLYKLQQSGMHMDEIVKKVAQLTKKSQAEIAEIFEEATYKSQSYDNEVYKKARLTPIDIKQSPQMLKILQATYEQTMGELKNFTRTTANASQSIFLKTMDDVYFRVMSGQQSYSEAIRQAINELASTGIVVSYPSGHTDTIETAVRRCVMTGVGQATAKVSVQNAKEMDTDLVLVSAHLGARPSHAEWQGKVYSISGNSKKYAKLSEATGYGTVTGLCGANCRHHFMPYIDGVSTNPYKEFDSKENEEYYNNQQTQRKKERSIRNTKRQLQALEISIDATRDDKLKFALQQDYDRKAAKLKVQMVDYKEFSKKAELPMQNERLQIAKWERQKATAARGSDKKYENVYGRNKITDTSNKIKALEKQFSDLTEGYSYDDFIKDFGSIEDGFEGASAEEIKKAKGISEKIESLRSKLDINTQSSKGTIRTKQESIEILKTHGIDFKDNSSRPIPSEVLSKYTDFITDFESTHSWYFNKNKSQLKSISIVDSIKGQKDFTSGIYRGKTKTIEINTSKITSRQSSYLSRSDDFELHALAHEYGHYIADTLEQNHIGVTQADIVQNTINKYFDGDIFKSPKDLKDILSSYGSTSYGEAFAEAFAEAYTCEKPRKFARLFKEELGEVLENTGKSGTMRLRSINNRNMANGQRRSPSHILTDKEIESLLQDAKDIDIPTDVLKFNIGNRTGFSDLEEMIHLRGDVLPDINSDNLRDLLSQKAVLAHEYYGHYKAHPSKFRIDDWRDEFQASYRAAIDTPNLSDEDRRMLMLDAYDRAKEAGVKVNYNSVARRIIYGYE